jgi:hypothetical protein
MFGGKGTRHCKFEMDAAKNSSASPDPGAYHDGLERFSNLAKSKQGCIYYNRSPVKGRFAPVPPSDRPGPGQYEAFSEFGINALLEKV